MNCLTRLIKHLHLPLHEPVANRPDLHTLEDIGIDPMGTELMRELHLWRDLAA